MATVDKRDWDVEPRTEQHVLEDEKKGAHTTEGVDVFAAVDDRDPALIPTDEDLATLPRVPAGMP